MESLKKRFAKPLASALFCCCGTIKLPSHGITVHYKKADRSIGELKLPQGGQGEPHGTISELLKSCHPASFGKGKETVYDESYRKAAALEPSQFTTNFDLGSSFVMNKVGRLLSPNSSAIRPELYKLNVYEKEGFFKPHVDTPRGRNMFGTLVVCLPCKHTGGELVVSHKKTVHTFSWGKDSDANVAQWAAFYSDCKHEIKKVGSGNRVTLTYNLFDLGDFLEDEKSDLEVVEAHHTLFHPTLYDHFKKVSKVAYPKGCVLGFFGHHQYVQETNMIEGFGYTFDCLNLRDEPWLLKGFDATIYESAKAAGLEVNAVVVRTHNFESSSGEKLYLELNGKRAQRYEGITWCNDMYISEFHGQSLAGYYGNCTVSTSTYVSAVILVTVLPEGVTRVEDAWKVLLTPGKTFDTDDD